MPVYTPPALNAVDFALTVQPAHSVAPAENILSVYTIPSLSAVDFALITYTPPVYNLINFEFLPGGGTTYEDTGTAVGIWAGNGTDVYTSPMGGSSSDWLPKKRKTEIIVEYVPEDIEDMKLSVVLMQKLADITNVNAELMRAYAEDRLRAAIALQSHPAPVIQKPAVKHNPQVRIDRVIPAPPPPEPKVSPTERLELMRRLEKANAAKEEKRQREEAIAKQRLKNLAKARRVARKNRDK